MATLYLVSTPIGNLQDVTHRAEAVLREADRVLAEDTRRARILLDHVGSTRRLVSLHEHNETSRIQLVLSWLEAGEDLALVSDAGTPLVSDPGARLVVAVAEAGFTVVPIPGPSAILAALVVSGLPTGAFSFLGFPPRKGSDRKRFLERVSSSEETTVLFESPERLDALLESLSGLAGGGRRVAVARELTKVHETIFRGTLAEARRYYREHPPRGEVTVVVAPGEGLERGGEADREAGRTLAAALLEAGERPSAVAKEVSRRLGIPRNLAYSIVQEAAGESD
jgi:16S rRNA (cytidine1402-2'-O)-methyltransferase